MERLLVGRIGRAVGLKGEVDVLIISDASDRFAVGSTFQHGDRALTIRSVRQQGERTIVAFEGVDDRNTSEALTGAELTIPASDARELDEAEYWDHDLVGAEVVTADGTIVGEVTDVLHTAANSVLVVRSARETVSGAREHLIPLVAGFVRDVRPGERITIDPPPGLLDD